MKQELIHAMKSLVCWIAVDWCWWTWWSWWDTSMTEYLAVWQASRNLDWQRDIGKYTTHPSSFSCQLGTMWRDLYLVLAKILNSWESSSTAPSTSVRVPFYFLSWVSPGRNLLKEIDEEEQEFPKALTPFSVVRSVCLLAHQNHAAQ